MGINPVALYNAAYIDVQQYLPRFGKDSVECTASEFASAHLLSSLIRKWTPDDSKEADSTALSTFISANNRCKDWRFTPEWTIDEQVLGETKAILDNFFHPQGQTLVQSIFDLIKGGRPGPGVAHGAIGTSLYTKFFASKLTTTSMYLYEEYKSYCAWIPLLSDAERQRYESNGPPAVVSGSKCTFVPKTAKTSRMVCAEPSLNMFFQLGLASILEERLSHFFGIDLTTQPDVNRRLARIGSLDGSLATIDLASASDSISLRLCEMLLPKWFFELLLLLRSHTTLINGNHVPLFMISTMGNGFTFPLMTIILSAIVAAIKKNYSSFTANPVVFGDDIIVETSLYRPLTRFLGLLGFTVNSDKSFSEGRFRESCGADWFSGQPVRPIYIRRLDRFYQILVAINQLNEWTSYTGIPLRNCCELLYRNLPPKFRLRVPFASNNDSGIRVPSIIMPRLRRDRNLSILYRTWDRRPSALTILDDGVRTPSWFSKKLSFNPAGLYCSFLFGELINQEIKVRHNLHSFDPRVRCTPFWDYMPCDSVVNGTILSWRRWETAVLQNLLGVIPLRD